MRKNKDFTVMQIHNLPSVFSNDSIENNFLIKVKKCNYKVIS